MKAACRTGRLTTKEVFAGTLCELFAWSGVSHNWLAIELKVSDSILSLWCSGRRFPTDYNMKKLIRVTGICHCCFVCEKCARESIATREGWLRPIQLG